MHGTKDREADSRTAAGFAPGGAKIVDISLELDPKTARILKALDRPTRPPAPVPEVRANSAGGSNFRCSCRIESMFVD